MPPAQLKVPSATKQRKKDLSDFFEASASCTPSRREAPLTTGLRTLEVYLVSLSRTPKWLRSRITELRACVAQLEDDRDRNAIRRARTLVKIYKDRRTIAELRHEVANFKGDEAEMQKQKRLLREYEEFFAAAAAANTACPELELFKED